MAVTSSVALGGDLWPCLAVPHRKAAVLSQSGIVPLFQYCCPHHTLFFSQAEVGPLSPPPSLFQTKPFESIMFREELVENLQSFRDWSAWPPVLTLIFPKKKKKEKKKVSKVFFIIFQYFYFCLFPLSPLPFAPVWKAGEKKLLYLNNLVFVPK